MNESPDTSPEPSVAPSGGERRRLERAPGERYAAGGSAGAGAGPARGSRPGPTRSIIAAVIVADLGAVLFFALGLLDLGAGLVVVAGFIGWVTALALLWRGRDAGLSEARTRIAIAALLGGWAVVAGIVVDWVFAVTVQGGVLGPIDYVGERYGPVAPLAILVAATVAGLRAR